MSFFRSFLWESLCTQLTSRRNWALLLLLPLLTFTAARRMPPEEVSAPVQVGVVLPEGESDFGALLEERSGLVVEFCISSLEEAERRVAAGRWDCALVLPDDFQARLDRRELEGLFTLLIGPSSVVYPLVRETVTACLAQRLSPELAADYLLDSGIAGPEQLDQVRPRLNQVLADPDRVLVSLETVDGSSLDPILLADRGISQLLAGLTAVLLLIWTLFLAMDLGRWLDSPFARRLIPLRGRGPLLLARLGAALILPLCAGALSLLALDRPTSYILPLVPYLLFWGAGTLLLARHRGLWGVLPILMPFVPVLSLLLSPILLDLSALFPALAPIIRWSPITLYLRTCGGAWTDGLLLTAAALVFFSLFCGIEMKKIPAAP